MKHPSGQPKRDRVWGTRSIERSPPHERLVPGLRRRDGLTHAVGFTADLGGNWDDE